jgi:hypothetical protein
MPYKVDEGRRRLGALISRRRNELSLSLTAAAKAAGIHRDTWTGLERAERTTEPYIYGRFERVLGWSPGSIERILAGGDPELLSSTRPPTNPPTAERPSEHLIKEIWADDALDNEEKLRLVELVIRADAQLRTVDELLRASRARKASGE